MGDPTFKPNQVNSERVQKLILDGFSEGTEVHVTDTNGDGYMFDVVVISDDFKGLNRIKQHQKVYALLQEDFKEKLHAVTLKTSTKEGL